MGGLSYPSSGFYRICRETEREVQDYNDIWLIAESKIDDATIRSIKQRCNNVILPTCCNLKEKIIQYYLMVRCKGITRHMENKNSYEISYSSASV